MSELPPVPPIAVSHNDSGKQAEPYKEHNRPYKRIILEVVIGGALIATARWPLAIGHFLDKASPALTALATVAVAFYTATLYVATQQIRESADATAERQFSLTEKTLAVMADQQVAMAAIADSMATNTDMVREMTALYRRMMAASHPPALTITKARIAAGPDGTTVIKCLLWNKGISAATIIATYMHDTILGRAGGYDGEAVHDTPDLVGQTLECEKAIAFTHICTNVRTTDRPEKSALPAILAAALRVTQKPSPPSPKLQLTGWILYENEGGDRSWYNLQDINCTWES